MNFGCLWFRRSRKIKNRKVIKVNRVLISYFGLALAASVFVLLGSSCSVRKYIPEGQTLYTGADLELDTIGEVRDYKELKLLLEELHFPKPNGKFLGTRPGLFFHYKSRADSGWIFRFLDRKMGEEPVFLEEVDRQSVEDLMHNRLENRGHFKNVITSSVETDEEKKCHRSRTTLWFRSHILWPVTVSKVIRCLFTRKSRIIWRFPT